jgi:hypothetical protein
MSNPDKYTSSWSQTDIQKYLNGELSAREMHQLEQAALDDPFLSDALEGLGAAPAAEVAQDMETLRTRLQQRVEQKRKKVVPLAWRVAAAVILLLGFGFMAWYGLIRPTPPPPAKTIALNTAENNTDSKKATQDSAATAVIPNQLADRRARQGRIPSNGPPPYPAPAFRPTGSPGFQPQKCCRQHSGSARHRLDQGNSGDGPAGLPALSPDIQKKSCARHYNHRHGNHFLQGQPERGAHRFQDRGVPLAGP